MVSWWAKSLRSWKGIGEDMGRIMGDIKHNQYVLSMIEKSLELRMW